jgi:hypothetical protein
MTMLKWLLITALLGYGGLLALVYVFQRSLMYFPDRARTPPVAAGLPQVEEVTLTSADGEKLIAWHLPPQGTKRVLIYFQGNAGALDLRAGRFKWLIADGTGLLALSGLWRPVHEGPVSLRRAHSPRKCTAAGAAWRT